MGAKIDKGKARLMFIVLQGIVFLYSIVSLLSKVAGGVMREHGLFSAQFIYLFAGMVLCMGVYAIVWQRVLLYFDLTNAYVYKSTAMLWSLLWAVVVFGEAVQWNNIIGALLIVAGIALVMKDD